MQLNIQDTFNKELPADPDKNNTRRQVVKAAYSFVTPRIPENPKLVHASEEVAALLGISKEEISSQTFLDVFSGKKVLENSNPYSMCYGGHQFGNWAGQLGDGRAINLAEVEHKGKRWAMQLKGAGATPYSRSADGLAVLRSSIREHLCSEAMYYLGVPTTRSLSLILSGDEVLRDMLYNGNAAYEKGAIVCRVAPSFIRFGNFQIFASREDNESLQKLADYTIRHFYPEIKTEGKMKYVEFFKAVSDRTIDMVVHWQRIGFVHGVMNTDNMSILGKTIDYGPYGWLEGYEPGWTPNTTDSGQKRYRFGNQPQIGMWNLFQLANALYSLVEEAKPFEDVLGEFQLKYHKKYLKMMREKLGFQNEQLVDLQLIKSVHEHLQLTETDMTIFFRKLGDVSQNQRFQFKDFINTIEPAFYKKEELKGEILDKWELWFKTYHKRLVNENLGDKNRKAAMNAVNPKYVLRNYMAQLAIDDANNGDYKLIDELYQLLKNPYADQPESEEKWFVKRPEWARHKVGCSMLSCSS